MTAAGERILFVELWRLGDAVAATAGLRALRLAKPNAEIAVLAHSEHGDPLFRLREADTHLRFDAFWTRGQLPKDKYLPWTIDYGELYRAAQSIRAFRPDHALLFRGDIREQLFLRMLGLRNIVDLKGPLPILPGISANLRPSGVPRWKEYVFHVREWSRTSVDADPHIAGVQRAQSAPPYVLLHPGASWRYKQWSASHVVALIRWFETQSYAVKLVAGPNDRVFIEALCVAYGSALPVEYPSLPRFYSLVASAHAVICNNSAALHIAEAIGTPCVALTGPSDPVRWGTYQPHSRTVTRSTGLPCHPCGEKRCVMSTSPCIDRISLGEAIEALGDIGITTRPKYCAAP
jgi:ADP-heptose:LPS heptosyltransferase